MIKLRIHFILAAIVSGALLFTACEKEEGENETSISSYRSDDSHHTGENCMNCHRSGGPGEGWFNVAGTVYDKDLNTPYPNATIRLYEGPGGTGTLKAIVEADQKGNFYTTEQIDFGEGLYAVAEGETTTRFMGSALTSGQCNQCHGESTGRIWVK